MKINMPVTQHEVELSDATLIVSKTDLKGQITYINREFIEISGFTEDELLGKAQNIVRHPDMPPEAFDDMWRALKEGRPWVGLVKNRCKNGDYYWVEAHAMPMLEGGQVCGYMSVRRKASRDQIQAAEAAYALFRAGKAGGMAIRDGRVVSAGMFGAVARQIGGLKVRSAIMAAMLVLTAIVIAQGYIGMSKLSGANDEIEILFHSRLKPAVDVAQIETDLSESRAQALLGLGDLDGARDAVARSEAPPPRAPSPPPSVDDPLRLGAARAPLSAQAQRVLIGDVLLLKAAGRHGHAREVGEQKWL